MFGLFKKEENAIDKFKDSKDRLITYDELESIPLNKTIQIVPELPGAIETTRITSNKEDSLMFTVSMKKNQLWEKHHHNCEEVCVIYKGKLTDAITGYTAGPMEQLYFNKFQSHYVVAEENSIFYVEFKKPKK